jgi:hypothetical protein
VGARSGLAVHLRVSPLFIKLLYDERHADAGNMLSILSLSFFTYRYVVSHQTGTGFVWGVDVGAG